MLITHCVCIYGNYCTNIYYIILLKLDSKNINSTSPGFPVSFFLFFYLFDKYYWNSRVISAQRFCIYVFFQSYTKRNTNDLGTPNIYTFPAT